MRRRESRRQHNPASPAKLKVTSTFTRKDAHALRPNYHNAKRPQLVSCELLEFRVKSQEKDENADTLPIKIKKNTTIGSFMCI